MFLLNVITPYRRQWLTTVSLSVGCLVAGIAGVWTTPYIAKLTAPDSTHRLKLTPSEASWVASLIYLGRLFGAILGSAIQDFIGRKKTLLLMCVPFAVEWTLIVIAPTVSWLYASLISLGLSVGLAHSASATFLGEIADPMIRGSVVKRDLHRLKPKRIQTILLFTLQKIFNIPYHLPPCTPKFRLLCFQISLNVLIMSAGTFVGAVMGGLLPMETFSYICLALTGIFIVTFWFVPESPYYLIANGNKQKAEESLRWYNKNVNVKQEMNKLQGFLESSSVSDTSIFEELKKRENQKSLLIIFLTNVFPYAAGLNAVNPYAEVILKKGKIELTPSVVVMGLSFTTIIACVVAVLFVDKFGRKPLMIGSGLGLTLGHVLLGSHFHMLSLGIDSKLISWLPVLSLVIVYFSIPCGLGTVKSALLGELFPPILKTPASLLFVATAGIVSFGVTKCYQPYVDLVGEKYVFWTFAMSALCSVPFSYFCIPETKQKSLIDIQEHLKKANNETGRSFKDVERQYQVKS